MIVIDHEVIVKIAADLFSRAHGGVNRHIVPVGSYRVKHALLYTCRYGKLGTYALRLSGNSGQIIDIGKSLALHLIYRSRKLTYLII